jgi:hypothetical protein
MILILSPTISYYCPNDGETRRVLVLAGNTRQSAVVDCRRHHHPINNQPGLGPTTDQGSHNNTVLPHDVAHSTHIHTAIHQHEVIIIASASSTARNGRRRRMLMVSVRFDLRRIVTVPLMN